MAGEKSQAKRFSPVSKIRAAAKAKPSNSGIFSGGGSQKKDPQPKMGKAKEVLDYAVNHHKSTSAKVNSK